MNEWVRGFDEALPVLHAAHPIWYQGRLRAVTIADEVYTVGWVEPRERLVLRAMALAISEAPRLTADQQLSFAAYYLLPEEQWAKLRSWPDDLIARQTGLPIDLVQRRRSLPPLDSREPSVASDTVCAWSAAS